MNSVKFAFVIAATLSLAACSTYSSTSVSKPDAKPASTLDTPAEVKSGRAPTNPSNVMLTKEDLSRPYEVIGDIKVTVNKTTIFNADPTPALVDERLREKAAELGADAVILVRYGTVGVSLFSWGSLDGQGRAVYFPNS